MQRTARILGGVCLALALLCFVPAFLLHCVERALIIGTASFLIGSLLGVMMAVITRTRRPTLIYACILGAVLTMWPLYHGWPPIYAEDLFTHGNFEKIGSYLDALRPALFLLGVPYPYARWGQHGPDPLPAPSNQEDLPPDAPAVLP